MKIVVATSKTGRLGLEIGKTYRVKPEGTRWFSVRLTKGEWGTYARCLFEDEVVCREG